MNCHLASYVNKIQLTQITFSAIFLFLEMAIPLSRIIFIESGKIKLKYREWELNIFTDIIKHLKIITYEYSTGGKLVAELKLFNTLIISIKIIIINNIKAMR